MEKVNLMTSSGSFVATVEIPRFTSYPDVIIWGQRIFIDSKKGHYVEAFSYAVPPSVEQK